MSKRSKLPKTKYSGDNGENREGVIAAAGAVAAVVVPSYALDLQGSSTPTQTPSKSCDLVLRTPSNASLLTLPPTPLDEKQFKFAELPGFPKQLFTDEEVDGGNSGEDRGSPVPLVETPDDEEGGVNEERVAVPTKASLGVQEARFEHTQTKSRTRLISGSYTRENSQVSSSSSRVVKSGMVENSPLIDKIYFFSRKPKLFNVTEVFGLVMLCYIGDTTVAESTKNSKSSSRVEAEGVTNEKVLGTKEVRNISIQTF